jgi:hypothetical protein
MAPPYTAEHAAKGFVNPEAAEPSGKKLDFAARLRLLL